MSVTLERPAGTTHVGRPIDRVDGRAKVTGQARYAADAPVPAPLHAVIVQSTIARGRIVAFDDAATLAVPGVVLLLTYRNAPKVPALDFDFVTPLPVPEKLPPLQGPEIAYDGQHVAAVVAETFEAAREGAALLRVRYAEEDGEFDMGAARQVDVPEQWFGDDAQQRRGDPEAAFAASEVRIDATYVTPAETHNPMEPSATVAEWRDGELTVHDATQWVRGTRAVLAKSFDVPPERVRVISPFVGGGFGCKGFFWPHPLIAAMAARLTGRAVKLVLTREQMFTSCGYRTETRQRIRAGASRDGRLNALLHDVLGESSRVGMFVETAGAVSAMLFDVPNVLVSQRVARLDVPTPTAMRAPGETPGTYALGCALDELAYACGLDPLEVLRRNHADIDPGGLPYSSKHLLACYERGAEAFGWSERAREPRAMRDGDEFVGIGVGTATFPALRAPAGARATIAADGSIEVASATHDIGTGMYTILAQIAADALGVDPGAVRVRIGDSSLPNAPVAGGSMSSASVGPAVHDAAARVRANAVALATSLAASPLYGVAPDAVDVRDGMLFARDELARTMSYGDVVALAGEPVVAEGSAAPGDEGEKYAFASFGAQFVEVRVDASLGRVRVSRALGVFDCGRILNPKTARSQMLGGITWGIGMALLEATVRDERAGAVVTNNLADYHVPVNADIGRIDVLFVEEPDYRLNPLGVRGVGEIGMTGVAAAIANAVYHATGVRVRDLPIVPEKLLSPSSP